MKVENKAQLAKAKSQEQTKLKIDKAKRISGTKLQQFHRASYDIARLKDYSLLKYYIFKREFQ